MKEALSALERGFEEEGWSFFTMDRAFLLYINVVPWFDPLRSEPRFRALVDRLGFPTVGR